MAHTHQSELQKIRGNIHRNILFRLERVEQAGGFRAISRTEIDQGAAAAGGVRDVAGVAQEYCRFGTRKVILGQVRDRLEQLRAQRIVEILGGYPGLRRIQTSSQFFAAIPQSRNGLAMAKPQCVGWSARALRLQRLPACVVSPKVCICNSDRGFFFVQMQHVQGSRCLGFFEPGGTNMVAFSRSIRCPRIPTGRRPHGSGYLAKNYRIPDRLLFVANARLGTDVASRTRVYFPGGNGKTHHEGTRRGQSVLAGIAFFGYWPRSRTGTENKAVRTSLFFAQLRVLKGYSTLREGIRAFVMRFMVCSASRAERLPL